MKRLLLLTISIIFFSISVIGLQVSAKGNEIAHQPDQALIDELVDKYVVGTENYIFFNSKDALKDGYSKDAVSFLKEIFDDLNKTNSQRIPSKPNTSEVGMYAYEMPEPGTGYTYSGKWEQGWQRPSLLDIAADHISSILVVSIFSTNVIAALKLEGYTSSQIESAKIQMGINIANGVVGFLISLSKYSPHITDYAKVYVKSQTSPIKDVIVHTSKWLYFTGESYSTYVDERIDVRVEGLTYPY